MLFSRDPRGRAQSELFGGILNIGVGAVCLAGGASGAVHLIGTDTGVPLVIVGGVLIAVGGLRLWRRWVMWRAERSKGPEDADDAS